MSDQASCWTEIFPKARKEHVCCECKGVISAGEKYHRFTGIWDHEAYTFKTCLDCTELRKILNKGQDWDDVTPFEGILQEIFDRCRTVFLDQFNAIRIKRGKAAIAASCPERWDA